MSSTAETPGPSPIDRNEPEAVQLRKAGEGAFWYALRNAGWTDIQIHNSLQTYRESIAHELASAHPETQPDRVRAAAQRALESLDDLIANTTDPGVEALGAQYELATALINTPA